MGEDPAIYGDLIKCLAFLRYLSLIAVDFLVPNTIGDLLIKVLLLLLLVFPINELQKGKIRFFYGESFGE